MPLEMPNVFGDEKFQFSDDGRGLIDTDAESGVREGTRTQILKSIQTSGTSATIYTVPEGKVLFITTSYVGAFASATTSQTTCSISINPGGASTIILRATMGNMSTAAGSMASGNNSLTYPTPLQLEAGGVVTITGGTSMTVAGGITGWLEDA